MKINFREQELELHYSMRIYIIYENIMGTGVTFDQLQSYTSILTLFYSAIVASLQYHKRDSNVTYDEFINWIDINPTELINEFSKWFVLCLSAQQDKVDEALDKKDNKELQNQEADSKK